MLSYEYKSDEQQEGEARTENHPLGGGGRWDVSFSTQNSSDSFQIIEKKGICVIALVIVCFIMLSASNHNSTSFGRCVMFSLIASGLNESGIQF